MSSTALAFFKIAYPGCMGPNTEIGHHFVTPFAHAHNAKFEQ
jgi:hypothetical protein